MMWFHWPTEYKFVTQAFGNNPQYYGQFGLPGHEGVDMRTYTGTEIRACWSGIVKRAEFHNAYGNHIRTQIELDGRTYELVYAHFQEPTHLNVGDIVAMGDLIGKSGNTGNSTGPHLHFSLKMLGATENGETNYPHDLIDPTPFFEEMNPPGTPAPPILQPIPIPPDPIPDPIPDPPDPPLPDPEDPDEKRGCLQMLIDMMR